MVDYSNFATKSYSELEKIYQTAKNQTVRSQVNKYLQRKLRSDGYDKYNAVSFNQSGGVKINKTASVGDTTGDVDPRLALYKQKESNRILQSKLSKGKTVPVYVTNSETGDVELGRLSSKGVTVKGKPVINQLQSGSIPSYTPSYATKRDAAYSPVPSSQLYSPITASAKPKNYSEVNYNSALVAQSSKPYTGLKQFSKSTKQIKKVVGVPTSPNFLAVGGEKERFQNVADTFKLISIRGGNAVSGFFTGNDTRFGVINNPTNKNAAEKVTSYAANPLLVFGAPAIPAAVVVASSIPTYPLVKGAQTFTTSAATGVGIVRGAQIASIKTASGDTKEGFTSPYFLEARDYATAKEFEAIGQRDFFSAAAGNLVPIAFGDKNTYAKSIREYAQYKNLNEKDTEKLVKASNRYRTASYAGEIVGLSVAEIGGELGARRYLKKGLSRSTSVGLSGALYEAPIGMTSLQVSRNNKVDPAGLLLSAPLGFTSAVAADKALSLASKTKLTKSLGQLTFYGFEPLEPIGDYTVGAVSKLKNQKFIKPITFGFTQNSGIAQSITSAPSQTTSAKTKSTTTTKSKSFEFGFNRAKFSTSSLAFIPVPTPTKTNSDVPVPSFTDTITPTFTNTKTSTKTATKVSLKADVPTKTETKVRTFVPEAEGFFPSLFGGGFGKGLKLGNKSTRKTRYAPSFAAIFRNIKGKTKQSRFTGFEIRPIRGL